MRVTVRPQSSSHQEVTFVVKASSKFSKIFEEYERKCNAASGVFRYHYDGARLRKDQTVGEIEPDDDEMVVDAFQEAAVGGRC
ncbi:hypothetical protein DFJ74DRAFT_677953 [Hyaloraphidium curvatum]|nr:hypothetical protein DFJ74DRAFT_677953 [Hyaloraphidium curvatum]